MAHSKYNTGRKVSKRQHCHGIVAFEVKKKVMQIPCTVEIGASEASMSQQDETAHTIRNMLCISAMNAYSNSHKSQWRTLSSIQGRFSQEITFGDDSRFHCEISCDSILDASKLTVESIPSTARRCAWHRARNAASCMR